MNMLLWEKRRESLGRDLRDNTGNNVISRRGAWPRRGSRFPATEWKRRAKQEPHGAGGWPVAGVGTRRWGENGCGRSSDLTVTVSRKRVINDFHPQTTQYAVSRQHDAAHVGLGIAAVVRTYRATGYRDAGPADFEWLDR